MFKAWLSGSLMEPPSLSLPAAANRISMTNEYVLLDLKLP